MGQIVVKFDNKLKQSEIVVPLLRSSEEEAGKDYIKNQPQIQQSSVFGIKSPLISINNVVIDFDAVVEFSLKSVGPLPSLTMVVTDRFGLIKTFDNPGSDNEIRVEILPQFDNAYKKISLTFYISSIRIAQNNVINLTGTYKLPALHSSNFKSFGKKNTYDLFSDVANETQLGFASNIEGSQDERYIYCDNKSYIELLSREIMHSGSDYQVLDFWVDFWNNLNLVDIYERYNTIDPDSEMMVWVSHHIDENREGEKIKPIQLNATLTNHPSAQATELFSPKYDVKNKTGSQLTQGTDKLYAAYSLENFEYTDRLLQDGDVHKDIFTRYEYLGEVYGGYDYLFAEKARQALIQKINSESIEVTTNTPLLGLMRGGKVNFAWYINDSNLDMKTETLQNENQLNDIQPNVPMDTDGEEGADNFKLDKVVSGQYLITSCNIKFSNYKWEYILTLNRPAKDKPNYIKDENK